MHRSSGAETHPGAWKTEPWDKGLRFSVQYSSVLHDVRSRFQHIQVLQTPALGKMLVLDGAIQTSERDESGYHEMIAHVPLCRRGRRAGGDLRVLIIGGGDGGVAREVLRHRDVARIDLVDIDEEVMNVARTHLPSIWRNPNSPADAPRPLETDERFRGTSHRV
jgi:spermidine synthase